MITVNGVDITFILPFLVCVGLFALQLLLCFKSRHNALKMIPVYFIGIVLCFALYIALYVNGSGFLDLSGFFAIYVAAAGGVMGLFVGAAWLIYKLTLKFKR